MKKPKGLPNHAEDESGKPNNDERATWAQCGLIEFSNNTGQNMTVEAFDVLVDFLTDLGHYCDRQGIDLQDAIRRAAGHYNAETRGKGNQLADITLRGYSL